MFKHLASSSLLYLTDKPLIVVITLIFEERLSKWYGCHENVLFGDHCKKSVGIDMGLKDFAILSNGKKISHPKVLSKYERKLVRCQRRLSKKRKGSHNREKVRHIEIRYGRNCRNSSLRRSCKTSNSGALVCEAGSSIVYAIE